MTKISAKVGEQVTCTNGHAICEVVEDIFMGDTDYVKKLGNWFQPTPEIGSHPVCAICGADFVRFGMIFHFADGWRTDEGTVSE